VERAQQLVQELQWQQEEEVRKTELLQGQKIMVQDLEAQQVRLHQGRRTWWGEPQHPQGQTVMQEQEQE
jgi:hypothetical protein